MLDVSEYANHIRLVGVEVLSHVDIVFINTMLRLVWFLIVSVQSPIVEAVWNAVATSTTELDIPEMGVPVTEALVLRHQGRIGQDAIYLGEELVLLCRPVNLDLRLHMVNPQGRELILLIIIGWIFWDDDYASERPVGIFHQRESSLLVLIQPVDVLIICLGLLKQCSYSVYDSIYPL